jgi:mRNA-degrading endonuclease RelE of RelBE toxin-antitoxin system
MMHIEIRKSAIKDLKSIPAREQARLHERISGLSAFPQIANMAHSSVKCNDIE